MVLRVFPGRGAAQGPAGLLPTASQPRSAARGGVGFAGGCLVFVRPIAAAAAVCRSRAAAERDRAGVPADRG
jgi:hypothetical protein